MSRQLALRLGSLVVLLAAFFGTSVQASAATPQRAPAGLDFVLPATDPSAGAVGIRTVDGQVEMVAFTEAGPDDVTIQASYKFNRANTERIYTVARTGGAAGLGALCVAIAPSWLKVIGCPVFVAVVLSFIPDKPPAGRCLEVYTKWTRPFIGVRYVGC